MQPPSNFSPFPKANDDAANNIFFIFIMTMVNVYAYECIERIEMMFALQMTSIENYVNRIFVLKL